MEKVGKLRHMIELKKWENVVYDNVTRSLTTYDETENYFKAKLVFFVKEYSSLGSLQEKRLCRDLIDRSLRRFHQYSIQEQCEAFYFEDPLPLKKGERTFEHIIPASTLRDLLLESKIDVSHALYPPIAYISKTNDKKLRDAGLVDNTNDLWHPFKRYVTAGLFTRSKVVDCFDNVIDPNSFTLEEHYSYVNKLFETINQVQRDALRLPSTSNLLKQLKLG